MSDQDSELLEAELRRLRPARLPDEFEARLQIVLPQPPRPAAVRGRSPTGARVWWSWLRWLAPVAAAALALLFTVTRLNHPPPGVSPATARAEAPLKADKVEIDRKLLASFDTVASLPDGEPVRFRCREWVDAVTFRDSARGVEVVQRTPRVEVVPVSFETY